MNFMAVFAQIWLTTSMMSLKGHFFPNRKLKHFQEKKIIRDWMPSEKLENENQTRESLMVVKGSFFPLLYSFWIGT